MAQQQQQLKKNDNPLANMESQTELLRRLAAISRKKNNIDGASRRHRDPVPLQDPPSPMLAMQTPINHNQGLGERHDSSAAVGSIATGNRDPGPSAPVQGGRRSDVGPHRSSMLPSHPDAQLRAPSAEQHARAVRCDASPTEQSSRRVGALSQHRPIASTRSSASRSPGSSTSCQQQPWGVQQASDRLSPAGGRSPRGRVSRSPTVSRAHPTQQRAMCNTLLSSPSSGDSSPSPPQHRSALLHASGSSHRSVPQAEHMGSPAGEQGDPSGRVALETLPEERSGSPISFRSTLSYDSYSESSTVTLRPHRYYARSSYGTDDTISCVSNFSGRSMDSDTVSQRLPPTPASGASCYYPHHHASGGAGAAATGGGGSHSGWQPARQSNLCPSYPGMIQPYSSTQPPPASQVLQQSLHNQQHEQHHHQPQQQQQQPHQQQQQQQQQLGCMEPNPEIALRHNIGNERPRPKHFPSRKMTVPQFAAAVTAALQRHLHEVNAPGSEESKLNQMLKDVGCQIDTEIRMDEDMDVDMDVQSPDITASVDEVSPTSETSRGLWSDAEWNHLPTTIEICDVNDDEGNEDGDDECSLAESRHMVRSRSRQPQDTMATVIGQSKQQQPHPNHHRTTTSIFPATPTTSSMSSSRSGTTHSSGKSITSGDSGCSMAGGGDRDIVEHLILIAATGRDHDPEARRNMEYALSNAYKVPGYRTMPQEEKLAVVQAQYLHLRAQYNKLSFLKHSKFDPNLRIEDEMVDFNSHSLPKKSSSRSRRSHQSRNNSSSRTTTAAAAAATATAAAAATTNTRTVAAAASALVPSFNAGLRMQRLARLQARDSYSSSSGESRARPRPRNDPTLMIYIVHFVRGNKKMKEVTKSEMPYSQITLGDLAAHLNCEPGCLFQIKTPAGTVEMSDFTTVLPVIDGQIVGRIVHPVAE